MSNGTRTPMRVVTAGLAVGLAFAATACGGDDDDAAATIPSDAGLVVEAVPTIRWDKADYTASAGDVVVALQQDDPSAKHTLAIVDAAGTQLPEVLEVNKVGEVDVGTYTLAAGTYRVICTVPGHTQMDSALSVS